MYRNYKTRSAEALSMKRVESTKDGTKFGDAQMMMTMIMMIILVIVIIITWRRPQRKTFTQYVSQS